MTADVSGRVTELRLGDNGLTGSIPGALGSLARLEWLDLSSNELSGPIPSALGSLSNLFFLNLSRNELSGSVPGWLGNMPNLLALYLLGNELTGGIPEELGNLNLWGLGLSWNDLSVGPIPAWLRNYTNLRWLYLSASDVTGSIPAWLGSLVNLEQLRLSYYVETGDSVLDIGRLLEPSDGHLDGVHSLRDEAGADLVHLIVGEIDGICGRAYRPGVFGLSLQGCGAFTFAHELGHNMGLRHDRYQVHHNQGGARSHPAYGYVNQRALDAGAPASTRWFTIMGYPTQCDDAGISCGRLAAFASPRLQVDGDLLGVPYGTGGSGVNGPADAVAVLNATGPAVALWRDRVTAGANRPPAVVGTLPDRSLTVGDTLDVDVSLPFVDPDGDTLTYEVSWSSPNVVTVEAAAGNIVTLTAVGVGTATIRVTATDPGGLSATLSFAVTVTRGNQPPEPVGTLPPLTIEADDAAVTVDVAGAFRDPDGDRLTYGASSSRPAVAAASVSGSRVTVTPRAPGSTTVTVTATDTGGSNRTATQSFGVTVLQPFTDDPIAPGETPIRAAHVTELRTRIDGLRAAAGLGRFAWTDPVLRAGVTRVRLVHLTELRSALAEAYEAAGRSAPRWTDASPAGGATAIRALHVTELRAAVVALE